VQDRYGIGFPVTPSPLFSLKSWMQWVYFLW